jgi:drug/metabolite transporter (DMT)-like permease
MLGAILLTIISGIGFGLIGVMFRYGQNKNVIPIHISMVMGLGGALFFGMQVNWNQFFSLPTIVIMLPILSAMGNLVSMHFTKVSLNKGPLSPLWVAMNLTFLTVIIYSTFMFSEKILPFQYLALISGIICVSFASTLGNSESSDKQKRSRKDVIIYALALLVVLLGNSAAFVIIKDLSTRVIPLNSSMTYMMEYRNSIFFLMYISMAVTCFSLAVAQKAKPNSYFDLFKIGLVAAVGSIVGMLLLGFAARLPAALIFTINGMVSILLGVIVSVVAFGEPRTKAWYGTVGFGILTVLLINLDSLI